MKLALDTDFFCWSVALAARWQTKATNDNTKNDPNTIISMLNHTFCFLIITLNRHSRQIGHFVTWNVLIVFAYATTTDRNMIEFGRVRYLSLLSFGKERALATSRARATVVLLRKTNKTCNFLYGKLKCLDNYGNTKLATYFPCHFSSHSYLVRVLYQLNSF